MRAFKNKWFHRWARGEGVSDSALGRLAKEIAEGKAEADLGGYLFKARVRRPGGGKSGGYRIIVGYKSLNDSARVIFLYAFAKSQRANITTKEEAALSLVAGAFLSATDTQLDKLLVDGSILEIDDDE